MALSKITADSIAANAISAIMIADGSITNAKLGTDIDASKLAAGTLPIARIADASVTSAKLSSGAAATNLGYAPMIGDGNYNSNTSIDLNNIVVAGTYRIGSTAANLPTGAGGYGNLLVLRSPTSDTIAQIYIDYSSGSQFTRGGNPSSVGGGGGWSAWQFSNSIGTSGQAWTDVTASRAGGTTYTNSTGKPIAVYWFNTNQPSNGGSTVYINGTQVGGFNNYGTSGGGMIIVPNGATYSITYSGSSLIKWSELR